MYEIDFPVAIRTARAAAGLSQQEIATACGIPKTTVARFEILEGGLKFEQANAIIQALNQRGVTFVSTDDGLQINVSNEGLKMASTRLLDIGKRRSDRKKPI